MEPSEASELVELDRQSVGAEIAAQNASAIVSRRLWELHAAGSSWREIAAALGRSSGGRWSVRHRVKRWLRMAGASPEWPRSR